ncbi:Gfo/Idh/MocA family protein [Jiangella alba]|uniref:Predicted dehydrogenase n=1 Tax=Jiangella alba TaxID=561176 RepID=A0A1H5PWB8_9ACTN|nr:Gfo/Idh/MocA family oxidoreductase [Jiangella alba]SEF17999.1 Predicted dehydrogenase [Jiangella alba]
MTDAPIRVGLIGLGRSGWHLHAAGLAELDQYSIVAAADPDPERRAEAEARFGCAGYAEPGELLADGRVELVVVATPSHTHVPLGVAALDAGKHVVVEKPLAQSTAEVDTLIAAANRAGRVATCFQNNRFEPSFLAVREIIASGRLGELILIRRSVHRYTRRSDWQTVRRYGGGELPNTASHFLDQLLLLVDDGPLELFADLRHTISAGDAEDHVKLVMKPKTGPLLDLESSSAIATPQSGWLIAGSTGGLTATDESLHLTWYDPDTAEEVELHEGTPPGRSYLSGDTIGWQQETRRFDPGVAERTALYYQHLARTLRGGADLHVTLQSVRRQIEVIERARRQTGLL